MWKTISTCLSVCVTKRFNGYFGAIVHSKSTTSVYLKSRDESVIKSVETRK